ncbi:TraC family protein, partial [Pseudomonas sp. SDO5511_1_S431]
ECYLRMFQQHLEALSQPGGLFEDTVVTQLPWRGQSRKVRLVVYRHGKGTPPQRGQTSEEALNSLCERLSGGLG